MSEDETTKLAVLANEVGHLHEGLQEVKADLKDFREHNEVRMDDLGKTLAMLAARPNVLGWIAEHAKWISILIGVATGAISVAQAFDLLGQ